MPQTVTKPKQNQLPVSSSASSMLVAAAQSSHALICCVSWPPDSGLSCPSPVELAWCLGAAQGAGWSPLRDASQGWLGGVLHWGLPNACTWGQLASPALAKTLQSHFQTQKLISES